MTSHECKITFETEKIDCCSGEGYNICEGISPMNLSLWYRATDGIEDYYDGWIEIQVNYCPFCGLKAT